MSPEGANTVFGILIAFVVTVISLIVSSNQQKKLEDPDDATVVELDDLQAVCMLQENGMYLLRTIRQSGNPQKDDQGFESAQKAVKAAITTFKRARIEYAIIVLNTETEFVIRRPYHSHRGRQESKKVGQVEIYKVA